MGNSLLSKHSVSIYKFIFVILIQLFVERLNAATPLTFTYQGRLTNAAGTPISDATVVVRFRILNSAGDCILYSENQTLNTVATNGTFSVEIGSDTVGVSALKRNGSEDIGNSMTTVFNNSGTIINGRQLAAPGSTCSPGYTPTSIDDRKIQITIVSTGALGSINLVLSPLQRISSIPYATVAETLNGYTSSQFLRLSGAAVAPTANVTAGNANTLFDLLFASSSANYNKLNEILSNYTTGSGFTFSSLNMSLGGGKITNLGTPTTGTDATNKTYTDSYVAGQTTSGLGSLAAGDSGKALVWNGTAWVAQTVSGVPTQTGHSGKYLTTDGTNTSWSVVSASLPTQTGNSGKYLTTDGTNASWATPAGSGTVTSVAATAPLHITGTATTTPTVDFVAGTALNDGYVMTITNGNQPAFVNPGSVYILKGGQTGATSLGTSDATDVTILANNAATVTVKSDGKVGIGTTSPSFALSLGDGSANDGSLMAQGYGTVGTNGQTLTVSGTGTRMFWYPKKAAFRAGRSYTTSWDDGSIGNYSVAMGNGTTASGDSSTAVGNLNTSSGSYSFSAGYSNTASGSYSSAFGSSSQATGIASFAINGSATGQRAVSMGDSSDASGNSSVAMGFVTKSESYVSVALGRYNVGGGTAGSWVATDPLFEIGIGTSAGAKANAVTVLKNGMVGVGTATPTVALDIGSKTDAIRVPNGNATTERPGTPANGMIRYNTVSNKMEAYENGGWVDMISSGATGALSGITDVANSGGGINLTPSAGNSVTINQSTVSTSTTSGALIVNGGAGIAGALNVGGAITSNSSIGTAASTAATGGANQNSPSIYLTANYWDGSASAIDRWSITDVLGAGANPTSTLTFDKVSGTSGTNQYAFMNGNVGIGTASPGAKLTIGSTLGGTAVSPTLLTNSGALGTTATNELYLGSFGFTTTNSVSLGVSAYRTGAGSDWTTTAIALGMNVDNTTRAGASLFLRANGAVGIGTSAPMGQLSNSSTDNADTAGTGITSASGFSWLATNAGYAGGINQTSTDTNAQGLIVKTAGNNALNRILNLNSNGTDRMVVMGDGKVGIGTTTPGQNLDVTGNIRGSGQLSMGSQTISGGTTAIDWNNGNTISTDYNCGSSIAFANLQDGGTYTLVVTDTGTTTCTFSTTTTGTGAGTVSYRFKPANAVRTATSHTVYTLMRIGSVVYVSWASGF